MEAKFITPSAIINIIRKQKEALKEKGIEPTVENLGKYSAGAFVKKIKEQNNG